MIWRTIHSSKQLQCWMVIGAACLVGCAPEFNPAGNANGSGNAPVVILGTDQTVEPGSWVRLDGAASYDPEGRELTYLWSQTGGPDVELQAWRTPIASFTAPATEPSAPLVFELVVSNDIGTAQATTRVRVSHSDPPPPSDDQVHADAGEDQGVLSGDWVILDGSDSTGDGAEALEFEWTQIAGVSVELQDSAQAAAGFEAPHVAEGLETLTFELLVTQGDSSDTDVVVVVVVPAGSDDGDDQNDPACSDSIDNDDDGLIDYPADPGCESPADEDESDEPALPACSDGMDNDSDGLTDYPADPGCDNTTDDDESDESQSQQIFSTMWKQDSEEVQARYPQWGVERSVTWGQWCHDRENDGDWGEEIDTRTAHCLETKVPLDYDGYVEIDWEGYVTEVLKAGPDDNPEEFERVVSEILELLTYLQEQRPLAKWGYYGWPKRKSWAPGWEQSFRAAPEIFEQSDVLFPSVYDFHKCSEDPDNNNYECRYDHEKGGEHVLFALELAEGKPVLVYTTHRYHQYADREYAHQIIPHDEYVNHLRYMMNLEYEGRRPLGVVTWGATRYFYNEGFKTDENGDYVWTGWRWNLIRSRYIEEMLPGETIDEYILRLHPMIYENAAEAVYGD